MNSDTALDWAVFQLSPRRQHCELFVSGDARTERIASGVLKPFVAHLKILKERVSQALSIKLEVGSKRSASTWFNKGTLERFVRFVSTPDILESVNTCDAEMSQLEGAKRLYSQGVEDQQTASSAENERGRASADATKKELQRAIEVRLEALKQDLTMASARASAAGFTIHNISELLQFADYFGAKRLSEACNRFISLYQRRPDIASPNSLQHQQPQKIGSDVRTSSDSDMSIDDNDQHANHPAMSKPRSNITNILPSSSEQQQVPRKNELLDASVPSLPNSRCFTEKCEAGNKIEEKGAVSNSNIPSLPPQSFENPRRLSVQDRINMFEKKQKEQTGSAAGATAVPSVSKLGARTGELQRVSSDLSSSIDRPVLRRWSGASDMSIDLTCSDSKRHSGMSVPSSPRTSQEQNRAGSWRGENEPVSDRQQPTDLIADQFSLVPPKEKSNNKTKHQGSDVQLEKQIMLEATEASFSDKKQFDLKNQNGLQVRRPSDKVSSSNHYKGSVTVKDTIDNRGKSFDTHLKSFVKGNDDLESKNKECPGSKEHNRSKEFCENLTYGVSSSGNPVVHIGLDDSLMSSSSCRMLEGHIEIEQTVDQPTYLHSLRKTESFESNKQDLDNSQVQLKDYIDMKEDTTPSVQSQVNNSFKSMENIKADSADDTATRLSGFLVKVKGEISGKVTSSSRESKFHKQSLASDQVERLRGKMTRSTEATNVRSVQKNKKNNESLGNDQVLVSSREVGQTVRPAKGNKELNNELKMKADELEKLFAEHKLRIDGDQSESSQIAKTVESSVNYLPRSMEKRVPESLSLLPKRNISMGSAVALDASSLIDSASNPDYLSRLNLGDFDASEDYRGKFYNRYMLKRDAKLRDEWTTKGAVKEAKLKEMQDSLEQSSAEMKIKFARSSVRSDAVFLAQQRPDKLRSFSCSANVKYRG